MSYTQFVDGYALEGSTFKNDTVLNSADDTAYKLGAINQQSDMPSATYTANFPAVAVGVKEVSAGSSWVSHAEYRGMIGMIVQNGVFLWLAMGKHTDTGSDPYTHTIVPTNDDSLLPSIVLQHEEKGSATNEEYQWRGVKIDSCMLSHDMSASGPNCLLAKLEVMAAEEADPAFALTNTPALPSTANKAPFTSLTRTWDYGSGNVALDGLKKVEIIIANGLTPHYDAGDNDPYAFTEFQRKQYQINLTMTLNTLERDMWDKKVARTNTEEMYFKWTRSTNDYIECTATNCNITSHTIVTPPTGEAFIEATLVPEALSFTVKDSVNGNPHYGDSS